MPNMRCITGGRGSRVALNTNHAHPSITYATESRRVINGLLQPPARRCNLRSIPHPTLAARFREWSTTACLPVCAAGIYARRYHGGIPAAKRILPMPMGWRVNRQ